MRVISWGGLAPRGTPRDGARQAQDADLRIERGCVGGGDVHQAELSSEHAPDRRQVDAELAQRAHERYARRGVLVVEAVARLGAIGGSHEPAVGVEAQRPQRQPGAPCELSDRDAGRGVVHDVILQPPPGGGSSVGAQITGAR
jgi:hypothetical protein